MEPYLYKPLANNGNIRLLRVSIAEDGSLRGALEEKFLEEGYWPQRGVPPAFAALSYTWGTETSNVTFICDGKAMQITPNLSEALEMSIRENPCEYLWVDQICINQADNEEKSAQVRRMTLVYAREYVYICEDVFNDYANYDERCKVETWEDVSFEESENLGVCFHHLSAWRAFSAFYDRPWFERLWVVQETLPARNASMVCGNYSVQWHKVKAAATWYTYKARLVREQLDPTSVSGVSFCTAMSMEWRLKYSKKVNSTTIATYLYSFHELMGMFGRCKTTDPRDRVFALLGISFVGELVVPDEPLLQANYKKSTFEVYRDTVRGLAKHLLHDNLALLQTTFSRRHAGDPQWPSWVPVWEPGKTGKEACPGTPMGARWKTKHYPDFSYMEQSPGLENELQVEGVIIGKVIHYSKHDHFDDWRDEARSERDECLGAYHRAFGEGTCTPNGDSVNTAWAMTMQAGQLQRPFSDKGTTSEQFGDIMIDMMETWLLEVQPKAVEEARFRRSIYESAMSLGMNDHWWGYTRQICCGRSWAIFSSGYIGLVDHRVQCGDEVAILWGMNHACVLRPASDTGGSLDRYTFIGAAYCHGDEEILRPFRKDIVGQGRESEESPTRVTHLEYGQEHFLRTANAIEENSSWKRNVNGSKHEVKRLVLI